MFDGLTLITPDKPDVERDAVCNAWRQHGGSVLRLARFWEPPSIEPNTVRLYGPDTFGLVVAQKLGLSLVSPDDAILAQLDAQLLNRAVSVCALCDVQTLHYPVFAKPVVPKRFRADVYSDAASLSAECNGLEPDTQLLISDPVTISAESRAFVLNGSVVTCSLYEGSGNADDAISVANVVASNSLLPATYVVDMAFIPYYGWSVLEFNATWGAGLNGCDPVEVVRCLELATLT